MEYSTKYLSANRFSNLDGIEAKLVMRLIDSKTHYAEDIWRLLKYADETALSQPALTREEKIALVFTGDNGSPDSTTDARVFLAPFIDDAWKEQASSLYIYVAKVQPLDRIRSEVTVNLEVIVHSRTSVVNGNGDPALNPDANPNDSDKEGNLVVTLKNRATVLMKNVIAEFNGIYLDGIGYLFLAPLKKATAGVDVSLWNTKSFYGHRISMNVEISGESDRPEIGY